MKKPDVVITIMFAEKNAVPMELTTNATRRYLPELLECWLTLQQGKGPDDRPCNKKDAYTVRIEVDLTEDIFETTSDTGNKGLTAGIVQHAFQNLDSIIVNTPCPKHTVFQVTTP